MILTDDEDPDVKLARALDLDPTFVPCRAENCARLGLHREHDTKDRDRDSSKRTKCPLCGADVTRVRPYLFQEITKCMKCPWRGRLRTLKRL
jgi:hypothetical protein